MSNCDVVAFQLVSWVGCGAWLYRFLIFALFLILMWVSEPYAGHEHGLSAQQSESVFKTLKDVPILYIDLVLVRKLVHCYHLKMATVNSTIRWLWLVYWPTNEMDWALRFKFSVGLNRVFLYKRLRIYTICSKTVVGQCVLTIPSIIAGSWFTSGQ